MCLRDPHLPQLYGICHNNSTPLFIALHDSKREGTSLSKSCIDLLVSGSYRSEVVRRSVHQIWPAITRRGGRYSSCECRCTLVVSVHPTNHIHPRPSIYACVILFHVFPRNNLVQAGLSMLANTGRWPAIYGQVDYPSLTMLSSIRVNNRGNVVIGANIASDRRGINHRGPLVWLCHEVGDLVASLAPANLLCDAEVFGGRYPGSALAIGEEGLFFLN